MRKFTEWVADLLSGKTAKKRGANESGNSVQNEPLAETAENPTEAGTSETEKAPETKEKKTHHSDEKPLPNSGKKPQPNSVEILKKIKKATLSLLNSLYMSNPNSCSQKQMVVWLDTDNTTFKAYQGFEQELKEHWYNESGYAFMSIALKCGKPENEQDGRKVDLDIDGLDIYLQEIEQTIVREKVVKRARISIFGGKGSLLADHYDLSSETLAQENRKFYYIGRGALPDMGNGGYRKNHIAIDDKTNLEANKHVSRAHARIGYSENIGFFLQVESGGSRLTGNRTRIFRDGNKIEVENTEVKEPLHNGDLIELGKAVFLQFIELE